MELFYLEQPNINRKKDIIEYINEAHQYKSGINGTGGITNYIKPSENKYDFEGWLHKQNEDMNNFKFPLKTMLLIRSNDNKLVGMSNLRLSKDLQDYDYGHIGYSIRPTEFGKGYSKIQLYLDLLEIHKYGIENCIMVCKADNIISQATIARLGGVFTYENENGKHYDIDVEESLKENYSKYSKYINGIVELTMEETETV